MGFHRGRGFTEGHNGGDVSRAAGSQGGGVFKGSGFNRTFSQRGYEVNPQKPVSCFEPYFLQCLLFSGCFMNVASNLRVHVYEKGHCKIVTHVLSEGVFGSFPSECFLHWGCGDAFRIRSFEILSHEVHSCVGALWSRSSTWPSLFVLPSLHSAVNPERCHFTGVSLSVSQPIF